MSNFTNQGKRLLVQGLVGGISATSIFAYTPALAQAADTDTVDHDTDIVVTAQKRSERLQDVPISITALSADALKSSGADKLTDIGDITPGLTFQPAGTFVQPMIRGVGSSNIAPGYGSNVGIYLDGFLLPNPGTSDFQLLNVQSVQILKGPQGTLFGRNTTGGAILVTTSDPSEMPHVQTEASYGSYNAQSYQAYATTGLAPGLAVDIGVRYARGDGWLYNIGTGKNVGQYENFNLRIGLKYQVTDNFYLLARYTHSFTNDASMVYHSVLCCNADGVPWTNTAYAPGVKIATGPNEVSSAGDIGVRTPVDAYQLTAGLDLGFANLTSYTQYRTELVYQGVDLSSSSVPSFLLQFGYRDKIFTQELLLASKPGPRLQWTTGLYFFSDIASAHTTGSLGGAPQSVLVDVKNRTETYAAYTDATYEITDKLFLTGGIRVAKDSFVDAYADNGPLTNLLGDPRTHIDFSPINKTTVTPRVVVRYKPDSRSSLYASFTKGYKSGFRNITAGSDLEVKPEKITSYEIGYKYASPRFSASVAAYYYDYKDLQVGSYQGPVELVTNAASSRVYGVEGDIRFAVTPDFEITAGAAYTDAKYKTFNGAPFAIQCTIAQQVTNCPGGSALTIPPGATVPPLGSFATGLAAARDITDSPMQFAPKFSGNIGFRYNMPLGGGKLVWSGNISYVTEYYLDAVAQFATDPHENLKLRAEWTDPSDHFTLAVFGENLTNKRYRTVMMPNGSAILTSWNAPLTVGGSVGVKF
ncbi:MAG: TonB-dependent receptor [Novosphingobium sp.]